MPANADFVPASYSAVVRGGLHSVSGMMRAQTTREALDQAGLGVRIAVYPRDGEPEVTEVAAANHGSATPKFTRFVMEKVQEAGGTVP